MTVIFDMDGTLINSANAICEAVNEIRKDLNLEPLPHAFIVQTINTPGKDWAKILYNIENFSHSSFKEGFERYFVKHYKQSVMLYDGVLSVLEWLKSRGDYLAIATNAPQASLNAVLERHGILPFFDKVLGISLGIEPKPHPMMLNLIKDEAKAVFAEKIGLKNSAGLKNCIFVGDSLKDKEAARNAKMPFLWAKWGEKSKNLGKNSKNSCETSSDLNKNLALNSKDLNEKSTLNSSDLNENEFIFTNADELRILLEKFI